MTFETWWLYATAVFLIACTPGPNMLHVMTRSVQVGPKRAGFAVAGCITAVLIYLTASALGLGAILKASPRLFDAMRYVGAAYLIWLGIKAWRAPLPDAPDPRSTPAAATSAGELYRGGLLVALSNPKLILFAGALLPQFIDSGRPFLLQLVILMTTFIAIDGFWYAVYAYGGRSLARWLREQRRQRLFDRITGSIFISFGLVLIARRA